MVTIHRPKVQSLVCFHYTNRLYVPEPTYWIPREDRKASVGCGEQEVRGLGCHSMPRLVHRYQMLFHFRHSRAKGRKTRGSFFRRIITSYIPFGVSLAPRHGRCPAFPAKSPANEELFILLYTTNCYIFNWLGCSNQKGRFIITAMFERSDICQSTNIARASGTSS